MKMIDYSHQIEFDNVNENDELNYFNLCPFAAKGDDNNDENDRCIFLFYLQQ